MTMRSAPRTGAAVLATCLPALPGVLLGGCSESAAGPAATASHAIGPVTVRATPAWAAGHRTATPAALPPEARRTLALIEDGGPYPYARDGIVFGNLERELPSHPRGYYHEYTVTTPGSPDRGARRIITGRDGGTVSTDDHCASFEAVLR